MISVLFPVFSEIVPGICFAFLTICSTPEQMVTLLWNDLFYYWRAEILCLNDGLRGGCASGQQDSEKGESL